MSARMRVRLGTNNGS
ncbi:hypothetical protein MTR67_053082 [Solanum verrucosum]|nr:hypothetical protein MTR67_031828 [Solanum verrucosum]WMV59697.1 hypothetical protein MTR67_053082 [Solanum verrucosum]